MKREKLDVVFNKRAVMKKVEELAGKSSFLTKSDIARAAMNEGLQMLDIAKGRFTDKEFENFIIESQEVQK